MLQVLNPKKNKLLKFSYKRLIILIIVAIGIYFLIPQFVGIKEGIKLVNQVKPMYLVLGILGQVISYTGAAFLLRLILKKLQYKLRFFDLIRMSALGAFAIHFFPLSGAGEAAINYYILREKDVSPGDALFLFIVRSVFTYIGFFLVFAIGLVIAPTHAHLTLNQKIISIILFIVIIIGTLWVRSLYQKKDRFWGAGYKFLGLINFFSQKITKKRVFNPETVEIIISDVYEGFQVFRKKKSDLIPAAGCAAIYWLGDMWTLFFSLLAFGYFINPGVMIFAYCVATLAGLLSFIPGGLGVIEGTMSLTLISLGVPGSTALFSVLLYRLISFWLLMPTGLVFFLSLQSEIANKKNNH